MRQTDQVGSLFETAEAWDPNEPDHEQDEGEQNAAPSICWACARKQEGAVCTRLIDVSYSRVGFKEGPSGARLMVCPTCMSAPCAGIAA